MQRRYAVSAAKFAQIAPYINGGSGRGSGDAVDVETRRLLANGNRAELLGYLRRLIQTGVLVNERPVWCS